MEGIEPKHCQLRFSDGKVSLIVADGLCSINSQEINKEQALSHGE